MINNKVVNNRVPFFSFLVLSGIVLFAAFASEPVYAETAYVSDVLKIPLRSGASNGHRIVKFLRSGTALTVLETDGEFTRIEVAGKSGWVLTKDIMDIPSGRDRLAATKKKFAKSDQVITALENKVAELESGVRQLKKEKGTLENKQTNLSNSLEDLKITAANPVALAKKNKQGEERVHYIKRKTVY